MPLTFLHRKTHNLFRRMTLLLSYSATGTRIKIRKLHWLDAGSATGL